MDEVMLLQTDHFQLSELDFFIRMLVATGIGLVIGFERELSHSTEKKEAFAGLRTITIVTLLGFIAAFLSFAWLMWLFPIAFIAVFFLVAISYFVSAQKGELGLTTEFAALFAFLLGGLTLMGYINISLAITVVIVVLLSLKPQFKNIIGQITKAELYAFIRFVVIALLLLPFLPDKNFGPFNVINPREIGWVVVLTSGIGFIGYILMKFLGSDRGILLTGILGGLVSSTVVTWNFSKKSKETPALSENYAIGIFAAASVMIIRVAVLIIIFNSSLIKGLIIPLLLLFATGIGVSYYFYNRNSQKKNLENELPLGEALNIRDAIFFGALYSGILILVSFASSEYGDQGIYISSAISALTDIDAITISVSKLTGLSMEYITAQNAILIATLSNTLVKIAISLFSASKSLKKYVLLGYGLIFIAGMIGFIYINYF